MVKQDEIKINDVVQITPSNEKFGYCYMIVEEIKSWGIQGYVPVPDASGMARAYIRMAWEDITKIGASAIVAPDIEP